MIMKIIVTIVTTVARPSQQGGGVASSWSRLDVYSCTAT